MSYTKRTWATGNVVGAVDLNRMEQGIEDAGSGQVLVVTDTEGTLDKTWQEIYDAFPNCYLIAFFGTNNTSKELISAVLRNGLEDYYVRTDTNTYASSSSNGYPEYSEVK